MDQLAHYSPGFGLDICPFTDLPTRKLSRASAQISGFGEQQLTATVIADYTGQKLCRRRALV